MKFVVNMSAKAEKMLESLSEDDAAAFLILKSDLIQTKGLPYSRWKNCGKLKQCGKNYHHCHISYSTVVVWQLNKRKNSCKITYVGTRESVPY